MDPRDQTKCYPVFQSKQAFINTYNYPALPNQQSINLFMSRPPAHCLTLITNKQLQLLQQQQQQFQSQHNFQRRSRVPTIWDCAPVLPFQYGMVLHHPQPQPHHVMIPCGAAKLIRLEEVADQQPSNGSVSNTSFPVSARLSPVQEAKLKPTQPPSESLGIKLGKGNGQSKGFVRNDEVRKATRGKRKRREEKKMEMDISMDVDTELRL